MRLECPRCHTFVVATPGTRVTCPQCGYLSTAPLSASLPAPALRPTPLSAARPLGTATGVPRIAAARREPVDRRGRAIPGLLLNALLPGVGTLYEGHKGEGTLQVLAFLAGVATVVFLIGLAIVAGAWLWAVSSSVVRMARPAGEPMFEAAE